MASDGITEILNIIAPIKPEYSRWCMDEAMRKVDITMVEGLLKICGNFEHDAVMTEFMDALPFDFADKRFIKRFDTTFD